jgi:hypothetical protein
VPSVEGGSIDSKLKATMGSDIIFSSGCMPREGVNRAEPPAERGIFRFPRFGNGSILAPGPGRVRASAFLWGLRSRFPRGESVPKRGFVSFGRKVNNILMNRAPETSLSPTHPTS